ncbi:MAG: glycosyltransferase family 87 protein [Candidatus Korobacteraceae bacterium]
MLLLALGIVSLTATWYFALAIAPFRLVAADSRTVPRDLYPAWYASQQAVLHHADPYSAEINQQIQIAMLGHTVADSDTTNQQRFAYPFYAVLFFAPLALLPFPAAQAVALLASAALTALSVLWWWPRAASASARVLAILFLFASYPVVLGLQLKQPTMLIAPLLAAAVYSVRSHRLVLAGCLAAIATCKPQLAIAVVLPLLVWTLAEWRSRKAFLLSLAGCVAALLATSWLMMPGWLPRWWHTLHAYAHYAGARPRLFFLLPASAAWLACVILIVAVCWVSWRWRDSDLLFAVGFSIAVFQLLFPFQIYNEVLLLPAVFWLMLPSQRQQASQLFTLLLACLWIVLSAGWISALALTVADLLHAGSAARFTTFPKVSVWLLPYFVFLAFVLHVLAGLSVFEGRREAHS